MPDEAVRTGVVIYPDVRGLYRFYEELALRFAERDIAAVAFDYFGRTAGTEKRNDEFEYMPHVGQTTDNGVQADARACVAHLRSRSVEKIFSVGFCFGGRASWIAAASGHGLAGSIGFYGSPTRRRGGPSAVERAYEIAAPILALQAGDDANITGEKKPGFEQAPDPHGGGHRGGTYDGGPPSVFYPKPREVAGRSAPPGGR